MKKLAVVVSAANAKQKTYIEEVFISYELQKRKGYSSP